MQILAISLNRSYIAQQQKHLRQILHLVVFAVFYFFASQVAISADAKLRQSNGGSFGVDNTVRLGLNKSIIVDLPSSAQDVLVSNPAIANAIMRTANRAYIIGLQAGETNIFFFDANGGQILNLELIVERNIAGLRSMMSRLIPQGDINVESVNDHVILTGSVPNNAAAGRASDLAARFAGGTDNVLNMLTISEQDQVALKITVAEVERSATRELGIDIEAIKQAGATTFGIATSVATSATTLPFTGSIDSLTGGSLAAGGINLGATVKALEDRGLLKTLAEPTLTAVSGESASFLAGGEFPIPVGASEGTTGGTSVTIEFKPFGVSLAFTPNVLSSGRISMRIVTEVSEVTNTNSVTLDAGSDNSLVIPGITTRKAETTAELPSGGSLVMAGLLRESVRRSVNGVPGLKDLPILGALFRSQEFIDQKTELVIIATPILVSATSRQNLTLPTDNVRAPNTLKALFLGKIEENYGAQGAQPSGQYQGNYGFIIK